MRIETDKIRTWCVKCKEWRKPVSSSGNPAIFTCAGDCGTILIIKV